MGGAVIDYFASRTPAQVGTDIKNGIDKIWKSVEADHAKAAAQGPEAEARWWGKLVGRVTFEVASTFVPIAGQAGKVEKAAKGVEVVTDAVRVADKAVEVVRIGDKIGDAARASDKVGDAVRAGEKVEDAVLAASRERIELSGGTKGKWSKELNGPLKPNVDYVVNGYVYKTDSLGRVTSVEGKLDLSVAARNGYQQAKVGKSGAAGDEGGHLIASIFNGPGEKLNLVPMNGNFNKGAWKVMENKLADAAAAGKKVEVKIEVIYGRDGVRPEGFRVQYQIDGVKSSRNFENRPGG